MGGSASRAFAEWQRETTLPESGSKSMGWGRVKVGLRVSSVSGRCSEPGVGLNGHFVHHPCGGP